MIQKGEGNRVVKNHVGGDCTGNDLTKFAVVARRLQSRPAATPETTSLVSSVFQCVVQSWPVIFPYSIRSKCSEYARTAAYTLRLTKYKAAARNPTNAKIPAMPFTVSRSVGNPRCKSS